MKTELVIERFNSLPENLQFQVFDYIEFLKSRYSKSDKKEKVEEEEISDELKTFLKNRLSDYRNNPQNVVSWNEIEEQFEEKYGYAI